MQELRPIETEETGDPRVLLERWREQLLRPLLLFSALVATPNVVFLAWQLHDQGLTAAPYCAGAVLLLVWWAGLSGGLSPRARLGAALALLYGTSAFSALSLGVGGGGVLGLLGFVAFCALVLGARAAFGAGLVALATIVLCALGFQSGLLAEPPATVFDSSNPWNWARLSSFGAAIMATSMGSGVFLLRKLSETLSQRTVLLTRLREEAEERGRTSLALDEAQKRLVHAHKLEAVGRLAGSVAHDFNNTLTVILSYAELLKSRAGAEPSIADLIEPIVQAAEQGGELSRQLLTFSRKQIVKPRVLDVRQVVSTTERTLSRLVPSGIRVHANRTDDELCVRIDPTLLQQAVLNLALNARDAMPNGGDLHLEASAVDITDDQGLPLVAGPYVAVRVRDTGTGMTDDTLARLFEPFFTTKEPGLGTGLGLANVRETSAAVGGHVHVASKLGEGSELTVYLPRVDARASGVETRSPDGQQRPATILVVDDEPQIREVIGAILRESGYVVHVAGTGKQAIELMRTERIDLLCVDIVMPDMPGGKLIDTLREMDTALRVLVCSAYGTDESIARRIARGDLQLLTKPFARKGLLDAVERALGSQARPSPVPSPAAG
jgi:signal transduction histidine kinase/ActR/RegA family two-component response regulator